MDFISFLILFGICVGVFLGILLITTRRANKTANRLFGILLLCFSFSISGFLIDRTNSGSSYSFLLGLPQTVLFLFGPLFYFYVKTLTKRHFFFREEYILHFLPFIFLVIYQVPFIVKSTPEKLQILNSTTIRIEWLGILGIQIIHLFVYIYFTSRIIRKHERRIKITMSSIEKINLRWLKMGIYFFLLVFTFMLLVLILYTFGIDLMDLFQVAVPLAVSIIICIMGFYGLRQPIIFPGEKDKGKPKKYEKSNLSGSQSEEYLNRLLNYMDTEKPFLQSNLTLHKLAHNIGISPHHLSQVINEKLNQNFFDFVNQYRVKEAQKMLIHPQGRLLTILAISEEVGFNSKTAFNTAFKKITQMTPSDFRKNGFS